MLIKYIASEQEMDLTSHSGITSWEKRELLTLGHSDIKC